MTAAERNRRLLLAAALLGIFCLAGALAGRIAAPALARLDHRVPVAERLRLEESLGLQDRTEESKAYRALGLSLEQAYRDAAVVQARFRTGGAVFGGWCGLVIGLQIAASAFPRRHLQYEAHQGDCLSCGRCFLACPIERKRLGLPVPGIPGAAPPEGPSA